MYTNINITSNSDQYKYIIEYSSESYTLSGKNIGYLKTNSYVNEKDTYIDDISFWDKDNIGFLYHRNYWVRPNGEIDNIHIPTYYKARTIKIYFPQHSVETYINGVNYALTLNTWVHGKAIVLGSYIINRLNLTACEKVKTFMNQKYYEYAEVSIIDPYDLTYSDNWKEFRENICGEEPGTNNTGSILYASLHPVQFSNIDGHDIYMKVNEYVGGQNSINLLSAQRGDMRLDLSTNVTKSFSKVQEEPAFIVDLVFNDFYSGNLKEYLSETYNIDHIKLKYNLVIGNEDNLYIMVESDKIDNFQTHYIFNKSNILNSQIIGNTMESIEGVNVVSSVDIIYIDEDGYEESLIYLLSNKIPLTPNIFRFFNSCKVKNDQNEYVDIYEFRDKYDYVINNIKLNDVDMNLFNITPINKIEQTIIQTGTPSDSKSNLINPVFFRTSQLANIVIHPSVTETICLNLDAYKSKVESFIIQIEGVNYVEIGRNKYGVLFKIVGRKLPKTVLNGTYYILDSNGEMITYGKYNYE